MAWTDSETARVELIEDALNKVLIKLNKTISKLQFRQLMLVRETEISDLDTRITAIESQLETITNLLNTMKVS